MSRVMGVIPRRMSYISSPQAARSASRQVFWAKNSWEGWWSMARSTRSRYFWALSGNSPRAAISTDTTVSGQKSSGASRPSR